MWIIVQSVCFTHFSRSVLFHRHLHSHTHSHSRTIACIHARTGRRRLCSARMMSRTAPASVWRTTVDILSYLSVHSCACVVGGTPNVRAGSIVDAVDPPVDLDDPGDPPRDIATATPSPTPQGKRITALRLCTPVLTSPHLTSPHLHMCMYAHSHAFPTESTTPAPAPVKKHIEIGVLV
jgi:hypothetical protein